MKKLPIEWTEEVEEETGLTLEDFFRGHLENACKQVHTNVTEKDVFGFLLDFEESKLNNKEETIPKDCTNYKDKIK